MNKRIKYKRIHKNRDIIICRWLNNGIEIYSHGNCEISEKCFTIPFMARSKFKLNMRHFHDKIQLRQADPNHFSERMKEKFVICLELIASNICTKLTRYYVASFWIVITNVWYAIRRGKWMKRRKKQYSRENFVFFILKAENTIICFLRMENYAYFL